MSDQFVLKMKDTHGLCHSCFKSNVCVTPSGKTGEAICTVCLKKDASVPPEIKCNCKQCPIHNDLTPDPVLVGVPEG